MKVPEGFFSRKGVLIRLLLFCLLGGGVLGLASVSHLLLRKVAQVFPDNYQRRGEEALRAGNTRDAEAIARRRLSRVGWDMNAHYLLARAQAGAGKAEEAARTILEAMQLAVNARGRKITVTGYDDILMFRLLADYLWQAGRYQFSGEIYRAGIDMAVNEGRPEELRFEGTGSGNPEAAEAAAGVFLKLRSRDSFQKAVDALEAEKGQPGFHAAALVLRANWNEEIERNPTKALDLLTSGVPGSESSDTLLNHPRVRLARAAVLARLGKTSEAITLDQAVCGSRGVRKVDYGNFTLPHGATATSSSLRLSRTGSATGPLPNGAFRATNLLLKVTASPAFGQWPILKVSAGGREFTRLYLDGLQPAVYDLPLWPEGVPRNSEVELSFLNDLFDPVTREDRDIRVDVLALH